MRMRCGLGMGRDCHTTHRICDLGNSLYTKQFKIPQSWMLVAQEHRAGIISFHWTWAKKEGMNEWMDG